METLTLISAIILSAVSVVFAAFLIADFRDREYLYRPWMQLALGATVSAVSGIGAYFLY